jgi:hypothetical protein
MQMSRVWVVLAVEFPGPGEAGGSIARSCGITGFWEGDFTEVPACYRRAANQSRPGDVLRIVIPAGGMRDRKAWS